MLTTDADLERAGAFSFAADLVRDRAGVFSLAAALARDRAGAFSLAADLERATGMAAGAGAFSSCAARAWALIALFTFRRIALFALAFGLGTASSATMGSSAG